MKKLIIALALLPVSTYIDGMKSKTSSNNTILKFLTAANKGDLVTIEMLLKTGINVNCSDNGYNALHVAAENGHLDIVKGLISSGADVNIAANNGFTALHFAAQNGHLDIVKKLTSSGANINKAENEGFTALNIAAQMGHLDCVKELINYDADFTIAANNGFTALHFASGNGHLDTVKKLIRFGADVNRGANDGVTPLHIAALNGHLDCVKELISSGAHVNITRKGFAQLHFATIKGHFNIVKELISSGANLNITANDGDTPLNLAAQKGNLKIVTILLGAEKNPLELSEAVKAALVKCFEHNRKSSKCAQCEKQQKGICSGCKVIGYCSCECQREDWHTHKKICELLPKLLGEK
jgi:ankyrin repeat protein